MPSPQADPAPRRHREQQPNDPSRARSCDSARYSWALLGMSILGGACPTLCVSEVSTREDLHVVRAAAVRWNVRAPGHADALMRRIDAGRSATELSSQPAPSFWVSIASMCLMAVVWR